MRLTQCDVILLAMLKNKEKNNWTAIDFQSGKYFVGYEATARMSDLVREYPDLFIVNKVGRLRALSINWDNSEEVKKAMNRLQLITNFDMYVPCKTIDNNLKSEEKFIKEV